MWLVRWLLLLPLLAVVLDAKERPEERVIKWIQENGGKVNFRIGKDCPTCVRGALATKPFAVGDLIAKIPFNTSVAFPEGTQHAHGTAYELLVRLHTEPGFNKTKKPWWDTLPTPDQVLCTELLSEQDLDVLQSSWLTRHAANMRQLADDFYNGRSGRGKPLNDVIAPASVSFETFLYVSALVTTRTFYFYHDVGGERIAKEYFLPALDMLNHPFEGPGNAWRENDDDWVYERATQPIKEGEQITHAYHVGLTHRPDMSFAVYGFVQKNDPPLLCAQDLPGFTWQRAFDDTPATDTEIDPQGHEAVREEVQRLKEILDGLPTTLEEDEKLLKKASNWKRRTMLELRVERKKALRHRIKHLQQLLDEL